MLWYMSDCGRTGWLRVGNPERSKGYPQYCCQQCWQPLLRTLGCSSPDLPGREYPKPPEAVRTLPVGPTPCELLRGKIDVLGETPTILAARLRAMKGILSSPQPEPQGAANHSVTEW